MCGIFGYVLSDTADERRPSLDRALQQLRHRGPDADGTFVDSGTDPVCGLAHTRLAIIDLSPGGRQPMSSVDGRYTVTFNGEIYNYREIRAELESYGARFVSQSDTEVLLAGYRRWGQDLLPKLRGMFAFGLWDAAERTLFLARDRLGVKPLYYARLPDGLIFASEVRALLGTGLVPRTLSREGVSSYLAFGSVREPHTIVNAVAALPPGSCAAFKASTWRESTYWAPPIHVDRRIGRADAVDELRELLRESVALRLISDVPVGVFLSGGLDSSAIVALATAASRTKVHTFTVTFDETVYDEARRAAETAKRFDAEHHPIHLSAGRALDEMEDALAALDQPSSDGINTYFVSKAVRGAGIAVALSGIGGDELFAGYSGFRRFRAARRLLPLLHRLPAHHGSFSAFPSSLAKGLSLVGIGKDAFAMYTVFREMLFPDQRRALFGSNDGEGAMPTPLDLGINAWANGPEGDSVTAYSLFELTNYLRNTLLRDTDVMGMAHALEIREPLLDHRLVERVLTLPGQMKLSARRNKPLLFDAIPNLPKSLARRPKMGFTLPFDTWLHGSLRGWAEERLRGIDILQPTEVRRLWSSFEQGRLSYSRIWTLLALLDWTQRNKVTLA